MRSALHRLLMRPRRRWMAGGATLALLVAPVAAPAVAEVPADLAVKIVMAAVAFDYSIDSRFGDTVEVAVVGASGRARDLKGQLDAFSDKKLKGKTIVVSALDPAALAGGARADIVFFADAMGGESARFAALCQKSQATSVSADEAGVAAGMALGIELTADGKPKLLINLEAAKAAGANFSAQVLKLARLIEGK